ncbi:MAG: DUF2892 domain-containing protein [Candidatus Omnitrophica bacterium]|nr:DUF2892 domain-containing protein [Candidatus Omnitrophota bacterium]
MTKNIGPTDKSLRLVAGIIIIGAGLYYKNWLGVLGIAPLLTSFTGYCPLYSIFGVSTRKK